MTSLKIFGKTWRPGIAMAAAALLFFASPPAHATDTQDLRAGLQSILQLEEQPEQPILIAIVYNSGDPASHTDADAVAASINSGQVSLPGVKLTAQAMSVSSFAWTYHAKVAYLAQGVTPESYDAISRVAASVGILTISSDIACVKSRQCVLGISTKSKVQIYYSPAAAAAARISFMPAFLMLVNHV